jgi:hypothetical protein
MYAAKKAILVGAGALVLSVTVASAAVVCNGEGDCWRVRGTPSYYRPELRLNIHPDSWRWSRAENDRYRWRAYPGGRRHYRQGAWVEID